MTRKAALYRSQPPLHRQPSELGDLKAHPQSRLAPLFLPSEGPPQHSGLVSRVGAEGSLCQQQDQSKARGEATDSKPAALGAHNSGHLQGGS